MPGQTKPSRQVRAHEIDGQFRIGWEITENPALNIPKYVATMHLFQPFGVATGGPVEELLSTTKGVMVRGNVKGFEMQGGRNGH